MLNRSTTALILLTALAIPVHAVKVACVGNSVTAFSSYTSFLQDLLGSNYTVTNCGLTGTTVLKSGDVPYWKCSAFNTVFATRPDIITIKLGTNDSKVVNWAHRAQFSADLNALIDTFQTMSPRPQIFLVLPTPSFGNSFGVVPDTIHLRIVPLIKSVAIARGLPYIDCHTPMLNHPEYFSDGVHLIAEGPAADTIAHRLYRNILGAPMLRLSDTLVTAPFVVGAAKSPATRSLSIANAAAGWSVSGKLTVAKRTPWLTVTIDSTRADSIVVNNRIDVSQMPDAAGQLYDTVTVHVNGFTVPDLKYRVRAWLRQADAFTSVRISPDTAYLQAGGIRTFSAVALNQFGDRLASQPAFTWTASAGTVAAGQFTAPSTTGGDIRVIASSSGISDTAIARVSRLPFLADSGFLTQLLVLENAAGSAYVAQPPLTTYTSNFIGNERTIQPVEGLLDTVGTLPCAWHVRTDANGVWNDDRTRDYFIFHGVVYLSTPVARTMYVRYIADEQAIVRFDTTVVVQAAVRTTGFREGVSAPVTIRAGVTRVLVKHRETTMDNMFAFRFADAQGTNIRGINFLFSPDTATAATLPPSPDAMSLHQGALFSASMHGTALVVRYAVGTATKQRAVIDLFDMRGRLMRQVLPALNAHGGSMTVDLIDRGRAVQSSIIVRMRVGDMEMVRIVSTVH